NVSERVLTGSDWKARISTQNGLLLSLTQNGVELLGPARLVVDGENAENNTENNAENMKNAEKAEFLAEKSSDTKLVFTRTVAGQSFTLTYWTENDALQFSASLTPRNSKDVTPLLKDLSVEFPCPNADVWGVNTAEGALRDRIFFRTDKKIDVNSRHGIYWRPLELETLYDSYYQPLWRNAFLKAEWAENAVSFSFRENAIPARVRWLNRCGEEKMLTASLSLVGPLQASVAPEVTVAILVKNRPYFGGGTLNFRDLRMTKVKESPESASRKRFMILPEMGGWRVENEAYSLRLTRFGTIQELVSKKNGEKKVLENASLYTDYGFGAQKDRFCAENEVETWSRFETLPDGALRLHFEGRLRKKDRFGRCPKPLSFVIEYTLDGSDTFTIKTRIDAPSATETDSAFLSWMIATPTADSFIYRRVGETVAEGKPLEVQGRSWQSKAAGIMPDEMVLASEGTPILRIHSFDGDAVTNVFQDRKNLFFSFYDGKMDPDAKAIQVYEWKMTVY
ncbi:MAG: hypothetical protein Q4C70_14605, partial [Planctomycetia bacterium]|nr:hypothetical protein [Planctomycetia bacterium]